MSQSGRWAGAMAACLLLCAGAGFAEAQQCGRCAGFGYSTGYNGPPYPSLFRKHVPACPGGPLGGGPGGQLGACPPGPMGGGGALSRGCCEIPGNWRLNVWDNYPYEPIAQRWATGSLHPEAPVPPPLRTTFPARPNPMNPGAYGPLPNGGVFMPPPIPAAPQPAVAPVDVAPETAPPAEPSPAPSAQTSSPPGCNCCGKPIVRLVKRPASL